MKQNGYIMAAIKSSVYAKLSLPNLAQNRSLRCSIYAKCAFFEGVSDFGSMIADMII
jgi:hypothetical protein